MNAITEAFQKAGVPAKPMRHRVWQIVKDHGPITAPGVAQRLGEDLTPVQHAIGALTHQGMLQSNSRRGWGVQSKYETTGADYNESLKYRRAPIKVPTPTAPAGEPKMTLVSNPARGAFGLPPALEDMTLRELKDVRDRLNAIFKP